MLVFLSSAEAVIIIPVLPTLSRDGLHQLHPAIMEKPAITEERFLAMDHYCFFSFTFCLKQSLQYLEKISA